MDSLPQELKEPKPDPANQARLAVLNQFSSALVHDLRTPLAVIRYAIDALRRSASPVAGTDLAEAIDTISEEIKDMDRSLAKLVEITHDWEFRPEELDLTPLLAQVTARVDPNGQVDWVYDLQSRPPIVWADRVRFTQVLRNLAQNAFRAMRGRGTVRISAWREPAPITGTSIDILEIADTGPGIADQVRQTLFDPFVSTKNPGMGLGLTYCQMVMKKHGGTIEVAESSPTGATFRLTLPARKNS